MPRPTNIKCQLSDTTIEIAILGDIYPYMAEDLIRGLAYWPDRKIKMKIMSAGGDAFSSFGLYDLLKQRDMEVEIYGIAASGAGIIAMAGKTIKIGQSGFLMIHEAYASSTDEPNAEEQKVIAQMNERQAEIFAGRTGMTKKKIAGMLAAETYLNADEALELGFVDEVIEDMKMAASLNKLSTIKEAMNIKTQAGTKGITKPEDKDKKKIKAQKAAETTETEEAEEVETEETEETEEVETEETEETGTDETVEVETTLTAGQVAKAALGRAIKVKVPKSALGKQAAGIVAAMTKELHTMRKEMDELRAEVEAREEEDEEEETALEELARVKAENKKLKTQATAPKVTSGARPGKVAPAAGSAEAEVPEIVASINRANDAFERRQERLKARA